MDFIYVLKAIIIAIVEGLTEFVPVSSTGHMILVGSAINFTGDFPKMFEVVIQLGAILAVVVLYWTKIKDSVIEFFQYIFSKGKKGEIGFKFGINVIVASIPALIMGMLFYKKIKSLFAPEYVVTGFIVGGFLLLFIENYFRKNNRKKATVSIDEITPAQAFKVGCFQVLSMWPGMSRSASTIMGGWVSKLSTPLAAEFSFFLAIPAMFGSSGKDLYEYFKTTPDMNLTTWISLIVGFIVAFIVSLIVIKKFIEFLKKRPMRVFAIYRIAAGIILAVLILTKTITLS